MWDSRSSADDLLLICLRPAAEDPLLICL